jgi:hypothetical protein
MLGAQFVKYSHSDFDKQLFNSRNSSQKIMIPIR